MSTSQHSAEKAYIVCHPGQCCDGYCVEEFEVHGKSSRRGAENAAESVRFVVERAVSDALAPVVAVLDEYASLCNPAPYTSERALYERLRGVVTPPGQCTPKDAA